MTREAKHGFGQDEQVGHSTTPSRSTTFDDWRRVPIGEGARAFSSVSFSRTVLVVARTLHTTEWVLDLLPELLGDRRIQVVFAVDDASPSAFHQSARDVLRLVEAPVIPWAQAEAGRFDLIISSSFNGSLDTLSGPLLLLPHGPGFGKPASLPRGGIAPAPRDAEELSGRGIPPTTVVVSHEEQRGLFPSAAHVRVVVAGDPAYDRLCASAAFRAQYRAALGVSSHQALVVLSSTWGTSSQFATLPDLPLRLAAELPWDDYRIAMIVHPNVWFGHGPWQLRAWLRSAVSAGVILVRPEGDAWRGALVASDVLVADHGSVALYGVAMGRPVVLAGFADDEVIDASPLAALGRRAPRLDLCSALRAQLDAAIDGGCGDLQYLAHRTFALPGRSLHTLRSIAYEIVQLDPPAMPPQVRAVSLPVVEHQAVTAHHVLVAPGDDGSIVVTRFAALAELLHEPPTRTPTARPTARGGHRHLAVEEIERDAGLRHSATVVWRRRDNPAGTVGDDVWALRALEDHPGCNVAATVGTRTPEATVFLRHVGSFVVSARSSDEAVFDPAVLPSALYGAHVLSTRCDGMRLRHGARAVTLAVVPKGRR